MGRFTPGKLDKGIRRAVEILDAAGVETFESCEGGNGHAFFEPTIRFYGNQAAGFHALSVAINHGLKVSELRRYWYIEGNEPHGPYWEMTLVKEASHG